MCFRTDVKSPQQAFSVSSEACEWILESGHPEYLKSLTPLKKWYKFDHEIRKGDLVLVSEYRLARVQWTRARVEDTHTCRDGLDVHDVEPPDVPSSPSPGKVLSQASDHVKEAKSDRLIIYPPSEVWGYDVDSRIAGVVASCHTAISALYVWYRNGIPYK